MILKRFERRVVRKSPHNAGRDNSIKRVEERHSSESEEALKRPDGSGRTEKNSANVLERGKMPRVL
jgi:hypothetical protein